MTHRRTRTRRGRLDGGHLHGREIRVTRCLDTGPILIEHWPADGHRDAIVLSTLPAEEVLQAWLTAHGSSVNWQ
ncbi:MAG: hypothetical protein U1F43_01730 [Myxococcota bacterium]